VNSAENHQSNLSESHTLIPLLEIDQGFCNCTTINLSTIDVFSFFKEENNVERILAHIPIIKDHFHLRNKVSVKELSSDEFEIRWQSKSHTTIQWDLSFLFKKDLAYGTILSVFAVFENVNLDEREISILMNLFLKKMKRLIERSEQHPIC
jgi:hypothetical protein